MYRNNAPSRRKRRITAIGDLNQRVSLQDRILNSKFQTGNEDTLDFQTYAEPWAKVETNRGKLEFDGVELTQKGWTHNFTIRYRSDVQNRLGWVLYKDRRYKVLDIENLDERSEFLILRCIVTGTNEVDNQGSWA